MNLRVCPWPLLRSRNDERDPSRPHGSGAARGEALDSSAPWPNDFRKIREAPLVTEFATYTLR
jgi:hypothetical protein